MVAVVDVVEEVVDFVVEVEDAVVDVVVVEPVFAAAQNSKNSLLVVVVVVAAVVVEAVDLKSLQNHQVEFQLQSSPNHQSVAY